MSSLHLHIMWLKKVMFIYLQTNTHRHTGEKKSIRDKETMISKDIKGMHRMIWSKKGKE